MSVGTTIETARLRLVPLTIRCTGSADDRAAIEAVTEARIRVEWPFEHYDIDALAHSRGVLEADPETEFILRYVVALDPAEVVGIIGCEAPDGDGRVVIGYSIAPEMQRRGYASEALAALIQFARSLTGVRMFTGYTYPELVASIRTMERCGFSFAGAGPEERTIAYDLRA